MTAKRTYFALLGLIILLIVGVAGSAYEVDKLLHAKALQLANAKLKYQTLSDEQKGLLKDKQDIATYGDLNNITKQIVPQDKDQAEVIREIINIAASSSVTPGDHGVKIESISFPESTLGTATKTLPASSGAAAAAPSSTTPSAAATSKASLSQLVPVPNIKGVYKLEITIANDNQSEITYPMLYKFLSNLENNRRTAQVSSINITPDTNGRTYLTFSITLDTYIKP
ncbi:MAG TPA: hypothetical protein VFN56_02040 [Candidatus Saccharimonadales bacterium]|nr:hypothetical protein [Candidatus Saccharimonadales bacterium]